MESSTGGTGHTARPANTYTELHKARLKYQGGSQAAEPATESSPDRDSTSTPISQLPPDELGNHANSLLRMQQQSQLERLDAQALRQSQEESLHQLINLHSPRTQPLVPPTGSSSSAGQNKILSASWPYQDASDPAAAAAFNFAGRGSATRNALRNQSNDSADMWQGK